MRSRLLPLLLLPTLVLLAGCSGLRGTGDLQYVPGQGNVLEIAPEDRGDPIELSGESLEGDPVDLEDYRGAVAVVNVWWSACGPCRTEMPMLVETAQEMPEVGFLGINTRNPDRGTAIAFEKARGVEYPSIYDNTGAPLLAFPSPYTPTGMPSTIVLDDQGRVSALINGAIPSQLTLQEVIETVQESTDG